MTTNAQSSGEDFQNGTPLDSTVTKADEEVIDHICSFVRHTLFGFVCKRLNDLSCFLGNLLADFGYPAVEQRARVALVPSALLSTFEDSF